MKLFAKRTKKAVTAEEAAKLALISEADKVALDLLTKDPTTLNAKQRRMIKRYEERMDGTDEVVHCDDNDRPLVIAVTETNDGKGETAKVEEQQSQQGDLESESSESDDDDDDRPEVKEILPSPAKKVKIEKFKCSDKQAATPHAAALAESTEVTDNVNAEPVSVGGSNFIDEEEIKKLIQSLNSKNRRKLTRQLEREGPSALAAIQEEALKLAEAEKPSVIAVTPPEPEPKGKKRKVDWSTLTPEERMRRQDQQRKQQQAAERRVQNGVGGDAATSTAHKHALNSERRRANRRKPKWQRMAPPVNTHDTSGFQMRKMTKTS